MKPVNKDFGGKMEYHYAIYVKNELTWQFILDCIDDKDAKVKGEAYKTDWLLDWSSDFLPENTNLRFCTLSKELEALRLRGKQYV